MTAATLTAKGQIVIPASMRSRLGLVKGAKVSIEERGDELVIRPLSREYFQSLAGALKTKGRLTRRLLAERRKDGEKE